MHLTRPKSSKGRSRPALNCFQEARRPSASPDSLALSPANRSLRPDPQPVAQPSGPRKHTAKHRPAPLNKYKVLPSIESKRSEVSPDPDWGSMSDLSLCERPQGGDSPPESQMCGSREDKRSTEAGAGLLLAVRAPCGRRFEQHFEPTDTLLTVKVGAEVMYGMQYGDVCIQTMDVPRRTYNDMDMSLDQCGILSRTLLCIHQNDV